MDSNKHRTIVNPYAKSRKRPRPSQQQQQQQQPPRQQQPMPKLSAIKANDEVRQTRNDRNESSDRTRQTHSTTRTTQQTPFAAAVAHQSRPISPPLKIYNPYSKSRIYKPPIISPNTTTKTKSQSQRHPSTNNGTLTSPTKRSISPPLTYNPYSKSNQKKPAPPPTNNLVTRRQTATTASTTTMQKPKRAFKTTNSTATSLVSQDASALIISASDKAGMDGIDRTKIDAIILRESGNSLYMQQQKRRDDKVNQRIATLQAQKQALLLLASDNHNNSSSSSNNSEVERQLQSWQASCPSRSTKVVVDMDMFYMACELLTRPHLDTVPCCVGRGMILTSNYKARKYGVRSAMAGFVADKLVEELSNGTERLIHVPSHFELYKEKSFQVKQVLKEYDPHLKSYSLDEAYLDLGPYLALYLEEQQYPESLDSSTDAVLTSATATTLSDDLHRSIRDALTGRVTTTDKMEGTFGDTNAENAPPKGEEESSSGGHQETSEGATDEEEVEDDDMEEMDHHQGLDEVEQDGDDSKDMNVEEIKSRRRHYDYMKVLKKYPVEICNHAIQTIVHHMRAQVQVRTGGLTCSAGMAPHSGLAKMASDINKPNGQLLVDPHKVLEFLHPLAVRKVPGIGRVTQKILQHVLQVETVQELYQQRGWIPKLFKKATANYLLKASVGHIGTSSSSAASNGNSFNSFGTGRLNNNPEEEEEVEDNNNDHQKGMSRERTFRPESNYQKLQERLDSIADTLSNDMMRKKVKAHTITVKVKLFTFDVFSRAKSLDRNVYIQGAKELKVVAKELLVSIKAELASKHAKSGNKKKKDDRDDTHASSDKSNSRSNMNEEEESYDLCCRLLGIRCSSLVHQDALPQQKPMDKFLTRTKVTVSASTKKEPGHEGGESGSETTPTPTSKENENSTSSNTQSDQHPQVVQESNTCPLCNAMIVGNNDVLNRHIDTCLNASTVRQVVREVTQCTQEEATMATDLKKKASQKQKLTDFW